MKLGETIELVRKGKGISIKDVIGNQISRSAYYRFVNDEADTSTSNLNYLLDTLNISLEELGNLGYSGENVDLQQISYQIKDAFEGKNVEKLQQIKKLYRGNEFFTSKEHHLFCLADILIRRLENKKIDIYENDLYQYLISIESWTHYEIVLYNNIMYAFPPEVNKLILEKAIIGMKEYSLKTRYKNELFRLLANSVILFLFSNDIKEAWKYVLKMNEVSLTEDAIFERIMKVIINGIVEKILDPSLENNEVSDAITVFEMYGSTNTSAMNRNLVENIEKMYQIKF
ncbi:Rgg/GadR/MutR family transcriptional regulator [uncultured Vagococcus sp.]|uniref:helix-turn-helix domain-containing protein n=1 Tax=uncultured Vagococcus sp. TaxID=189676 RepID=UPI0028D8EC8C|nr:Rgg/GadR/MutR family transcriptional regulator [uncultured Vagococcus sp.]